MIVACLHRLLHRVAEPGEVAGVDEAGDNQAVHMKIRLILGTLREERLLDSIAL